MFWKVTLMRSGIGLPKRRNDTLTALGLRKRFRTVYKPVNPQITGLLLRVKELVKVDLVSEEEVVGREEMRERRRLGREDRGYVVESVGTGYLAPVATPVGV
jgi:large subunit ribosomal protein L30